MSTVIDFAAWLSTRPGTLLVGSAHSSPAILEAAQRFLALYAAPVSAREEQGHERIDVLIWPAELKALRAGDCAEIWPDDGRARVDRLPASLRIPFISRSPSTPSGDTP